MNPFNGMTREEMLRRAMMRPPAPRPQQVDISTFRVLKCDCGSIEMEPVASALVRYNPLAPGEVATTQFVRQRCISCKKYPTFENGEWTFVVDPPPITVE